MKLLSTCYGMIQRQLTDKTQGSYPQDTKANNSTEETTTLGDREGVKTKDTEARGYVQASIGCLDQLCLQQTQAGAKAALNQDLRWIKP